MIDISITPSTRDIVPFIVCCIDIDQIPILGIWLTGGNALRLKKLVQISVFIFCKASVMFHAEICHFSAQICLRKDSSSM